MKGSMEGVLPMMGLLILAAAMGFQTLPITEAFNEVMSDSTEGLANTVDAKAYAEFYFYNYVPIGAEHAINEAAWELGQEAGGLEWNNEKVDDIQLGISTASPSIRREWQLKSIAKLNKWVEGSEGECKIPAETGADIHFYIDLLIPNKNGTKYNVYRDDQGGLGPLSVKCPFGQTEYYGESYITRNRMALDNRYNQLANTTIKFYNETKKELNDINRDFSGDGDAECASSPGSAIRIAETEAEREAKENLENAVSDKIEQASTRTKSESEFLTERSEVIKTPYTPGSGFHVDDAGWKHIGGNVEREGTTTGSANEVCCAGEDESCPDDEDYSFDGDADATASPVKTNVNWGIEDSDRQVIVGDEYRKLEFKAEGKDAYTHYWNGFPDDAEDNSEEDEGENSGEDDSDSKGQIYYGIDEIVPQGEESTVTLAEGAIEGEADVTFGRTESNTGGTISFLYKDEVVTLAPYDDVKEKTRTIEIDLEDGERIDITVSNTVETGDDTAAILEVEDR
jgi:hypothetical protein